MSEGQTSTTQPVTGTHDEMLSALFAQLVMQQANMAMLLLGKVPHPETGQVHQDIDAARVFIDQLEMLEVKTKGNLTKEESALLKQSLMSLHLGFVEAVESPKPSSVPEQKEPPLPAEQARTASPPEADEHRKKFSKKY